MLMQMNLIQHHRMDSDCNKYANDTKHIINPTITFDIKSNDIINNDISAT